MPGQRVGANPSFHKTSTVETVSGRFAGGAGAVGAILGGKGFSVTYVSAGLYRIQMDTNYSGMAGGVTAGIMSSTHPAYQTSCKGYNLAGTVGGSGSAGAGTCSFDMLVTNASTPTDLSASEELWFSGDFIRTQRP